MLPFITLNQETDFQIYSLSMSHKQDENKIFYEDDDQSLQYHPKNINSLSILECFDEHNNLEKSPCERKKEKKAEESPVYKPGEEDEEFDEDD